MKSPKCYGKALSIEVTAIEDFIFNNDIKSFKWMEVSKQLADILAKQNTIPRHLLKHWPELFCLVIHDLN